MSELQLAPDQVFLGRYTLLRPLGSGMGGRSWLARGPGGQVVLKLLCRDEDPDGQRRADLLREATLLQAISHDHVVGYGGIHDLPEEGWTLLITEFVPGGDLEQLLEERAQAFPPEQAAALGLQLVVAVEELHRRSCLHRDLKPSNVLVTHLSDRPPLLRVADFGISRRLIEGRAHPSQPLGSMGYAAPEQYDARPLSAAADRYALGAILLYLASGRHPPALAPGPHRLAREQLLSSEFAAHPAMPALAALVGDLMRVDAAQRPQLPHVRRVLEAIAEGRPPSLPAPATTDVEPEPGPGPAAQEGAGADPYRTRPPPAPGPPLALVPEPPELPPEPPAPAPDSSPVQHKERAPVGRVPRVLLAGASLLALALLLLLGVPPLRSTWRGDAERPDGPPQSAPSGEASQVPSASDAPALPDEPAAVEDGSQAEGEAMPPEHTSAPSAAAAPLPEQPAAPSQELTVSSRPVGARVLLDGAQQGVTPLQVAIPATAFTITLEDENGQRFQGRCVPPLAPDAPLCWNFKVGAYCRRSQPVCP